MKKRLCVIGVCFIVLIILGYPVYLILSFGPLPYTFQDGKEGVWCAVSVPRLRGPKLDLVISLQDGTKEKWKIAGVDWVGDAEYPPAWMYENIDESAWYLNKTNQWQSHTVKVYFYPCNDEVKPIDLMHAIERGKVTFIFQGPGEWRR